MGHYRYHLCHLHWDSDIPWKPGWDQCYLVELSGERVFFIGSIHGHVFRGFGGGIYSRPSFNSFQVVYLGIPSLCTKCRGWFSAKVCPGRVRDTNEFRAWGGNSARGGFTLPLPSP